MLMAVVESCSFIRIRKNAHSFDLRRKSEHTEIRTKCYCHFASTEFVIRNIDNDIGIGGQNCLLGIVIY